MASATSLTRCGSVPGAHHDRSELRQRHLVTELEGGRDVLERGMTLLAEQDERAHLLAVEELRDVAGLLVERVSMSAEDRDVAFDGLENGTWITLIPWPSRYLSVKSSTLPKPSVATFSVPGFSFAAFSKSAQVLNGLFSGTKMKEGPWSMTATGSMSSSFQRASLPASSAWLSAM